MSRIREIGRLGQKRYGGVIYEEFLTELQGNKGAAVYREMSDNDDVVGAVLFAIEMLIRQTTWDIQEAGAKPKDKECAEFLRSCMDDMTDTWTDTISEILSFLTYGWSAHEIVYKRRCGKRKDKRLNSKFDDGLIGWQKLPIRAQESLYEWRYEDGTDDLTGMVQMPPPDYGLIEIPINRLLLFRTKSRKGNPEGRSILRNAYRSWYFKKRIQEIEGIGIERDLAGLPVMTAPEGQNIWDADNPEMVKMRVAAEELISHIRRDSLEGIVKPKEWELELLSTGGQRQFDTSRIIDRYDTRIAMTVLADFILLGHEKVGSFALSSDKTELFAVAIGGFLDIICEAFNNNAIPKLVDLNGEHFKGITDYPRMIHGDIENADLEKLGVFLEKAVGSNVLTPDENIEDHIREVAGLPERVGEWQGDIKASDTTKDEKNTDSVELDEEDEKQTKMARNALGRGS